MLVVLVGKDDTRVEIDRDLIYMSQLLTNLFADLNVDERKEQVTFTNILILLLFQIEIPVLSIEGNTLLRVKEWMDGKHRGDSGNFLVFIHNVTFLQIGQTPLIHPTRTHCTIYLLQLIT